jgi:hypothetical protein
MPIVSCLPAAMASLSFVPTPSVVATRMGSRNPAAFGSKKAPKPPRAAAVPLRAVARASGLIASTSALPASMSTPADL